MRADVKRRVRTYGIPIDLVILATGVAMLGSFSSTTLVVIYLSAVILSALKLGPRSGTTAMLCALGVMLFGFNGRVSGRADMAFVFVSLIAMAAVEIRRATATAARAAALAPESAVTISVSGEERLRIRLEKEAIDRRLEENRLAAEREVAEQAERLAAPRLETERQEGERGLEEARAQAERESVEREAAECARVEAERVEAERLAIERQERERTIEEERLAAECARVEGERVEAERLAVERQERERTIEEERLAAERAAEGKITAERLEIERLDREREERALQFEQRAETIIEERAAEEQENEELTHRIAEEREQAKPEAGPALEPLLVTERATLKQDKEQRRAERTVPEPKAAVKPVAPSSPARVVPDRGIVSTVTSWLNHRFTGLSHVTIAEDAGKLPLSRPGVNLKTKKISGNAAAPKRPAPSSAMRARPRPQPRRPRILMLERRRASADVVAPKLRDLGVDVQIVERWIDAGDELARFRPDAIFLDAELAAFYEIRGSIAEHSPSLPIFVTTGTHGALPEGPRAGSVIRPYNAEAVVKLALESMASPQNFLKRQRGALATSAPPAVVREAAFPRVPIDAAPQERTDSAALSQGVSYQVDCFNCRVAFDAAQAVSCCCLANERTLMCTNCLTCFCKAPPSYKEKFWLEAPPPLFERKSAELRRQHASVPPNPGPEQVRRPLVMLVEDDHDIHTIVLRICSNLGYGFVSAKNGEEGLSLARRYQPNLILSDAFMPKLDGREMCRILKEESVIPDCKMVVMTGLYTDTKYKNEALKRFHLDDYLSKPVSITDLINLLQNVLEGGSSAPAQEDLHDLHRSEVEEAAGGLESDRGIALAELIKESDPPLPIEAPLPRAESGTYEVCCFTCGKMFDAAAAEWCMCLGRDQTLLCPHCTTCLCKAPASYKERFWMGAPSTLFERKMIGSKRSRSGRGNPSPKEVKRPLILLVEDDENIQLIVKTVVTTMGYGFIVAADGQEGLAAAREYDPDLILSDAFMPKLDGREMCRLLKEDPSTARAKAIIMTGLYTDRKYRTEALMRFKVDDYVAKPVAVDDLIKLMKKHLPLEVQPTM